MNGRAGGLSPPRGAVIPPAAVAPYPFSANGGAQVCDPQRGTVEGALMVTTGAIHGVPAAPPRHPSKNAVQKRGCIRGQDH
jgi:hypothetical protein